MLTPCSGNGAPVARRPRNVGTLPPAGDGPGVPGLGAPAAKSVRGRVPAAPGCTLAGGHARPIGRPPEGHDVAADQKGGAPGDAEPPRHPEGWTEADAELDRRLTADEARLARDERELTRTEDRVAEEERWIQRNWRLALALGAILALTIAALVISVIALNRDIEAVAKATPKDDSVGSAALQDGAVTRSKIADGAVGRDAIASDAVGGTAIAAGAVHTKQIGERAVDAAKVVPDSLTGAQIDESTLGQVPSAASAGRADDASALGGVDAGRYLSNVTAVRAASGVSRLQIKGPVIATCPTGTIVVGGGAHIDGLRQGVALTSNTPGGERTWRAEAAAAGTDAPWRLVVTAICARGG